jgi:hypothetical protein
MTSSVLPDPDQLLDDSGGFILKRALVHGARWTARARLFQVS